MRTTNIEIAQDSHATPPPYTFNLAGPRESCPVPFTLARQLLQTRIVDDHSARECKHPRNRTAEQLRERVAGRTSLYRVREIPHVNGPRRSCILPLSDFALVHQQWRLDRLRSDSKFLKTTTMIIMMAQRKGRNGLFFDSILCCRRRRTSIHHKPRLNATERSAGTSRTQRIGPRILNFESSGSKVVVHVNYSITSTARFLC